MKKIFKRPNILGRKWIREKRLGTWPLFTIFLLSSWFLAYSSFSYFWKLLVILFGVVLPLILGVMTSRGERRPSNFSKPIISMPSAGVLTFLVVMAFCFRFSKFFDPHPWPTGDEALEGFFALELLKKWSWRFFYFTGQHPPLIVWLLDLSFRFFKSPFFSLGFPAALFSALTPIIAYPTARCFFEKDVSFLFSILVAFSFWPLQSGWLSNQAVLVPFFLMICFYLLGSYLNAKSISRKRWWAMALGLGVGVGSLTYTSWLAVIAAFFLLMFFDALSKDKKIGINFLLFSASFLIAFSPWIVAAVGEKFGGYLVGVSIASGFFTWSQQVAITFSSLTTLFWGPMGAPMAYGPAWGGLLNPFLGACFFLGVIELYQARKGYLAWSVLLMFLFIAPGVFAADHVEPFRMIQVLPILFIFTALGLRKLITAIPPRFKILFLCFFIILSSVLDVYLLWQPRLEGGAFNCKLNSFSGDENQKAYDILKPVADRLGPGLIFTEFLLLSHNHTLRVATYPFNALDNPKLQPSQARWVAVITNTHYGFFLEKRFPVSHWAPIPVGNMGDGGEEVGIIPVTAENWETIQRWMKAHEYIHSLGVESEDMMNNPKRYALVTGRLSEGYNYVQDDPFLESIFSEWFAQYHFEVGLSRNILFLRRGIEKGYPTANLYYKIGGFYYWNHEFEKSKEAYLMAARCRPNYTNAKEILSRLWAGEK